MHVGKGKSFAWFGLLLLTGCAANRPQIDQALLANRALPAQQKNVSEQYVLSCPDVVEVAVEGRPNIPIGNRKISPDGRIDLGTVGRVRIEGLTVAGAVARIADAAAVAPQAVRFQVVEFNSQEVFLFGQVNGLQRAVPYRGRETVFDLLQRVGGITPGAEPTDVYVVRSHIAGGCRPEVFLINLSAIAMQKDQRTNLRLEPFDQVFIGETRQSSYAKCIPPCLRPLYDAMCGLPRTGTDAGSPPTRGEGTMLARLPSAPPSSR